MYPNSSPMPAGQPRPAFTVPGWLVASMMMLALTLPFASVASAQGSQSFDTGLPTMTNAYHGVGGEVEAVQPLKLHRVAVLTAFTGSMTVELWVRDGGFSAGSNPWRQIGTATAMTGLGGAGYAEVPITMNEVIGTGERLGIAVITTAQPQANMIAYDPSPRTAANSDIEFNSPAAGLGYSSSSTPPFSNTFSPRGFIGEVSYDLVTSHIEATLNGPTMSQSLPGGSTGPHGTGVLLNDTTIAGLPGLMNQTVNSVTYAVTETGAGANANQDLTNLDLYYDSNTNGSWDASDQAAAGSVANFNASTNEVTVSLNTGLRTIMGGNDIRLFLVATPASTAISGTSFAVRVDDIATTSNKFGLPTADAAALVIDNPALNVMAAATNPLDENINVLDESGNFDQSVLHFDISASGTTSTTISSFTFTLGGTGDWGSSVETDGFQVWQDTDNNGSFNATTDTNIYRGTPGPSASSITTTGMTAITLSSGGSETLFVVAKFMISAGTTTGNTYSVRLASTADVTAAPAVVSFSTAAPPNGPNLQLFRFAVTTFTPTSGSTLGGNSLTIRGEGFQSPVTIRIAGTECNGTATVNGTATEITGLTVPPGPGGDGYVITYEDPRTGQIELTQTFSYAVPIGAGGGSTCSADPTGATSGSWATLLLLMIGLVGLASTRGLRTR